MDFPKSIQQGFIYALHHEGLPSYRFKLGFTNRHPLQRAREFSIGVVAYYRVIIMRRVISPREAEWYLFFLMEDYRVRPDKEFVDVYELDVLQRYFNFVAECFSENKTPILVQPIT